MLKILKELVASGAITQEVADQLNGEWKEHTKVLNDENKTLRTENVDLSKNYEEILKSKSDLDVQLQGLDDKIAQAKKDGHDEVATQLQNEKDSKIELQTSLNNLQIANTGLKLDSAVSKALKDFDLMDEHKDTTEFMLRARVSMNDANEIIYKNDGVESNITDGFKGYFETNIGKLNAEGGGDGGSGAGGAGGGSGGNANGKFSGNTEERKGAITKMIADEK